MVEYRYPWLPPRCSSCSKWGHLQEVCLTRPSLNKNSTQKATVTEDTTESPPTIEQPIETLSNSPLAITMEELQGDTPLVPVLDLTIAQNKGKKVVDDKEDKSQEEGPWLTVSPTKVGRQKSPQPHKVVNHASPSRFDVLAVEEDTADTEGQEEGEIVVVTQQISDASENLDPVGVQGTRPYIPRVSKSQHKVVKSSANQSTKGNPSVSGHRAYKKK
ncbi:unnamed protein product [Arabidopsis thaliana]|uniref:(thale cress) hypothetical protein n=1 Tax=Arabidopsis thaliana TaxID=3702 RepID=A0A7G2DX24_ARATH|nr:unnamed protein product [Arabidopsis thaliana]